MYRIIDMIIDITNECYLYQNEKKIDLIELPFYLSIIELFLENKKRKIDLLNLLKLIDTIEEKVKKDKILITEEDEYMAKDYIFYTGIWNKEATIDKQFLGKKLDFFMNGLVIIFIGLFILR
jgi:hypothetical protein